jgi:hypothetical protein
MKTPRTAATIRTGLLIGPEPSFTLSSRCGLTNRASAAGASSAGAPCARSYYATGPAHKRNSSLLGRARQLQALVRRQHVHESPH